MRPAKPVGEVYRHHDTDIDAVVSLRTIDIESDLKRFHRWQNSERVAEFWEERGTLEDHRAFLAHALASAHSLSLIGSFDDEPFAYFEAYWAVDDRIAPHCDAAEHDRGIHMLVGEEQHRGAAKVKAWLTALCHYLFLDESRTRRIVCEPRADNQRMIWHLQALGFEELGEFDFPHKRAALMSLPRELFLSQSKCRGSA